MSLRTQVTVEDGTVRMLLSGDADSAAAPVLNRALGRLLETPVRRLELDLTGLTFLSSAALRCLVNAHQALGRGVPIVVVGAAGEVAETMRITGFAAGVTMLPVGEG
ncbi:STAS domain-containing protein [Micromonospora sp. SCSIO 07396]